MPRLRGSSSRNPIARAPRFGFSCSAHDHLSARAGTDHQNLPCAAGRAAPGEALHEHHPDEEPGTAHQEQRQEEAHHHHRARDLIVERLQQQECEDQDRGRDSACPEDADHVRESEVPPPFLVQPAEVEHDQVAEYDEANRLDQHLLVAVRDAAGGVEEAQPEGQIERDSDQHGVGGYLDQAVPVNGIREPVHAVRNSSPYHAAPVTGLVLLTGAVTDKLVDFATDVIGDAGYAGVFVLMTLESALIPIPSEATMLFAGFKVDDGTLTLLGIVAAGVLGNLVGSWIAYAIGYFGRLELLERHRVFHVNQRYLDWADDWFQRHGDATVFFTRMMPIIRTFISLPAGIARMPFWRFTWLTILGCIPWVFALGLLGREVGSRWEDWKDRLHYPDYAVLAGIVVLIAYLLIRRRRGQVEPATEG
jgi:membrane protein DedA with SNARE-associated domain